MSCCGTMIFLAQTRKKQSQLLVVTWHRTTFHRRCRRMVSPQYGYYYYLDFYKALVQLRPILNTDNYNTGYGVRASLSPEISCRKTCSDRAVNNKKIYKYLVVKAQRQTLRECFTFSLEWILSCFSK